MPNSSLMAASAFAAAALLIFLLSRRFYRNQLRQKDRSIRDLSDLLSMQQQQSFHDKNELNAILSSMVEGVVVVAGDDRILYVSPNASEMFQMRSKDVALKPYWEVIPHQQINSSIKEALSHRRAVNKEISLIGGQDVFFNMQISPVIQEGRLTSVVAVFHNITELKRLLKMRSEFVANVSHELKTPLTSIKGFVETLQEEGFADEASARKFLGIIHKQTQRLEALVMDLLSLSAIESKEAKMEMAPQDIAPIIQGVVTMYQKRAESEHKAITAQVPDHLPKIYGDRNHLEQVFINLVDNAIKFTPPNGKITVRAKAEPPFMRVEVEDTGVGIASEHLSRVFERFYRVDKARSIQLGGTGLGLAIVKHIVQGHHGKIEVQSIPGKGSTFVIFLPFIK